MEQVRAIIVAYTVPNRVIGDHGLIPWLGRMPADMEHVQDLTTGNAIIMGLNTFNSIVRPLPNRQNIVLSADKMVIDGVDIVGSFDEAFSAVESGRTLFIFGGASVYKQALEQDLVDVIYATEIHGEFSGDAFFPALDLDVWREVERQDFPADENNVFPYSFVIYKRKDQNVKD
ncbi:dihydrofolate reductase [Candidatus Saccharibacteria bacterium]|nr:dihydrofolate reductase [Candidatus Saccharibacteria bacterium]